MLAADIYCHSICLKNFLRPVASLDDTLRPELVSANELRKTVFDKALPLIDMYIRSGHGLSVTEIRELVLEFNELDNFTITNKHTRKMLIDHYIS